MNSSEAKAIADTYNLNKEEKLSSCVKDSVAFMIAQIKEAANLGIYEITLSGTLLRSNPQFVMPFSKDTIVVTRVAKVLEEEYEYKLIKDKVSPLTLYTVKWD